jgi:hypothetical protein
MVWYDMGKGGGSGLDEGGGAEADDVSVWCCVSLIVWAMHACLHGSISHRSNMASVSIRSTEKL